MKFRTVYCLGFAFSLDHRHVLLLKKRRPDWQAGLLNGIGGRVESNELPADAMNRQCREETSLAINGWQHIVDMHCGADIIINVFRTFDDLIYDAADVTDEEPQIVAVPLLWEHAVIPNLHWLIPLCLDQQIITDPHSRPAMGAHNLFFEDNPS